MATGTILHPNSLPLQDDLVVAGTFYMNLPLAGKKIAVLVETEYIREEIEFYQKRIPELGGQLTLLTYLWGKASADFINDVDHPDRPITSLQRLTVSECVTNHEPEEFDAIICAANYVAVRLREIPPMGSFGASDRVGKAPAVRFFAKAMENPTIVKAAMCHALWLLTPRPELLQGRNVICHTVVLADICNCGAVYTPAPDGVVVDRDLVTARSAKELEPYFDAIVKTIHETPRPKPTPDVGLIATMVVNDLGKRFAEAEKNFDPSHRPVASAAKAIIAGTFDLSAEVERLTGVHLATESGAQGKRILMVASKFGTWASEFTIVASVLAAAGYRVDVATEDGSAPHLLSSSLDPAFKDGAWRCSVVSASERDLALRYLRPDRAESEILKPGSVFDLRTLPKPPQIGDYVAQHRLLGQYESALVEALKFAYRYEGLVIAGGSGAIPGLMADRGLHSLILAFHKLEKPIMAECNGGLALAQTIDPETGGSVLLGRAATTHSRLDEYQAGWGWVAQFSGDPSKYWRDGVFDDASYAAAETWQAPGVDGNPLIDCEGMFRNAVGPRGILFSPYGTPYCAVIDGHIITCRTTPDGYPGTLLLLASIHGHPRLKGRFFVDADSRGRTTPGFGEPTWSNDAPR